VTAEQVEFGAQLRRERERRKVTLSSVAESTKINKSLLTALERGDPSQWPSGIYRRAFLREYAAAVGLPSESMIAEFQRLFPESGSQRPNASGGASPPQSALRLTLAADRRWPSQSFAMQVAAAILDGAAILGTSAVIAKLLQLDFWAAAAIFALIYHSIATAWLGGSLASSIMNTAILRGSNLPTTRNRPKPRSREMLHIVSATPRTELQSVNEERGASPFPERARSAS
jgi:transcriptional regulator with XRE-family HTH domain